jgi:hypothetical protein
VPALRQALALNTGSIVRPISIAPAPSADRIEFFGIQAAMSLKAR